MTGRDMIKTANLIKNTSQLTKSGVTESIIVKTKDVLDPARGGGKCNILDKIMVDITNPICYYIQTNE